jgi:hypothetical protein
MCIQMVPKNNLYTLTYGFNYQYSLAQKVRFPCTSAIFCFFQSISLNQTPTKTPPRI